MKIPLTSNTSILAWFEENICSKCAFYRSNDCSPKISRDWKDAVSEIERDVYYSSACFRLSVRSSFKELDEALGLTEISKKEDI